MSNLDQWPDSVASLPRCEIVPDLRPAADQPNPSPALHLAQFWPRVVFDLGTWKNTCLQIRPREKQNNSDLDCRAFRNKLFWYPVFQKKGMRAFFPREVFGGRVRFLARAAACVFSIMC